MIKDRSLEAFDPHTKADEQLYAKGLDQILERFDTSKLSDIR